MNFHIGLLKIRFPNVLMQCHVGGRQYLKKKSCLDTAAIMDKFLLGLPHKHKVVIFKCVILLNKHIMFVCFFSSQEFFHVFKPPMHFSNVEYCHSKKKVTLKINYILSVVCCLVILKRL